MKISNSAKEINGQNRYQRDALTSVLLAGQHRKHFLVVNSSKWFLMYAWNINYRIAFRILHDLKYSNMILLPVLGSLCNYPSVNKILEFGLLNLIKMLPISCWLLDLLLVWLDIDPHCVLHKFNILHAEVQSCNNSHTNFNPRFWWSWKSDDRSTFLVSLEKRQFLHIL